MFLYDLANNAGCSIVYHRELELIFYSDCMGRTLEELH